MADEDFSFPEEDEGEGGDCVMTSKELLGLLETAWLNEKFAPEILHHKLDVVECMMEQLNTMQENLEKAKSPDLKLAIHKLEIERIRFMLSSYMRERLHKIEYFCTDLLDADNLEEQQKLTQPELMFAQEYQTNFDALLEDMAFKNMPPSLQNLDPREMRSKPNANNYVFVKVNKSTPNVHVDSGFDTSRDLTIDLEAGNQHLMMYKSLKKLLNDGDVSLI